VVRKLCDHPSTGPKEVAAQSKARHSDAISLVPTKIS
jgi:hypothetical protein